MDPPPQALHRRFEQLPPDRRRLVQLHLCENALGVWQAYLATNPRLDYIDSVVGASHQVDTHLPADALAAVRAGADDEAVSSIRARYGEPIVAMQDDDLRFPVPVEYAYYALYNLFRRHLLQKPIDDWLIVNQALSAETDESRWEALLTEAIAAA